MHVVSFIVFLVFFLLSAVIFWRSFIQMRQNNTLKARGLFSNALSIILVGIVISVVLFGFFDL